MAVAEQQIYRIHRVIIGCPSSARLSSALPRLAACWPIGEDWLKRNQRVFEPRRPAVRVAHSAGVGPGAGLGRAVRGGRGTHQLWNRIPKLPNWARRIRSDRKSMRIRFWSGDTRLRGAKKSGDGTEPHRHRQSNGLERGNHVVGTSQGLSPVPGMGKEGKRLWCRHWRRE